jgi:uncharacterized protein
MIEERIPMKKHLLTAVDRHPIVLFIGLAYIFSWWLWPLYTLNLSPATIVGIGPFLAALVVLSVTGGKPAIARLLRQIGHWRVGLRWYGMALGLPLLFSGSAALLNVLLGAPPPDAERLAQWPVMLPAFLLLLLLPGIGGTWEEPGWRGYLLPKLATGRSQMGAALLLGVIIAGWHLPLFLTRIIPWADLLFIFGTVLIFNWLYYRSGGSLLIIMIFHAMNNAVGQYFPALFSGPYVAQFALLQGEICLLVALGMVAIHWTFWSGRPEDRALLTPQVAKKRPMGT